MQDSFDLTTIIFIALAVFVIWRLRSVLGQRTGNERPPYDPFARRETPAARPGEQRIEGDNVVRLPGAANDRDAGVAASAVAAADRWKGIAEDGTPLAASLDAIVRTEQTFDAKEFLEGAKIAYEMIVLAFAKGDRKALKPLLARDVYDGFDKAITERESKGEKVETTFVSIDDAKLTSAEVRAGQAQLTVKFVSKLITATRDAAGAVIDGSADTVADVTDHWTFARTLGSRDPNWQLIATEAGH